MDENLANNHGLYERYREVPKAEVWEVIRDNLNRSWLPSFEKQYPGAADDERCALRVARIIAIFGIQYRKYDFDKFVAETCSSMRQKSEKVRRQLLKAVEAIEQSEGFSSVAYL